MATGAQGPSPSEYIVHHLGHMSFAQEPQSSIIDFSYINWDTVFWSVLTAAEIMVSIVCLEFAYTQSPPKMKSFVMGVYFLGVSLGNIYVSGVNIVIDNRQYDGVGASTTNATERDWLTSRRWMSTSGLMIVRSPPPPPPL